MVLQIIEWMLGTTGRALLDLIKSNMLVFNIFVFFYLVVLGLGKLQLKKIKRETEALALEIAAPLIEGDPTISIIELFDRINPIWLSKVDTWAYFIPHKLEIFVVKATHANVLKIFEFSPDWIEELLISKKILNPF